MLIGGHVSPAGGLAKAVERGTERECQAIQIFNQSPRAWRPNRYSDADFAAFREALAASEIEAVLIHAVYLLNCASEDEEIGRKSHDALVNALRLGDEIGALAVVLHAGSAKTGSVEDAIARAGSVVADALAESGRCALHFENTAGGGGTLGRTFDELDQLIAAAGGGERLGICLDSCHLLASGHDVRTVASLAAVIDAFDAAVGLDRLGSLHVNDSVGALGSNRDRHANLGEGELGREGCGAFLAEPRFEGLPCVLEVAGADGKGPEIADVWLAKELRAEALSARAA